MWSDIMGPNQSCIGEAMFGNSYTPVKFERDCAAVIVPEGSPVELPAGTIGYITQQLGGSFTVYVEGRLFRIAGDDADAIGKEPPPPPVVPDNASNEDFEDIVVEQLKTVFDPEIPINIVDLGLVYRCDIRVIDDETRHVEMEMTLTAPGCGMGEIIVADVQERLSRIPTVRKVDVKMVFDPPWSQAMMSEEALLETGLF